MAHSNFGLPSLKKKLTGQSDKENQHPSVEDKNKIFKFFKSLTSGKLKSKDNPNIPFQLFISNFRRRKILEALMAGNSSLNDDKTKELLKIYKNFLSGNHFEPTIEDFSDTQQTFFPTETNFNTQSTTKNMKTCQDDGSDSDEDYFREPLPCEADFDPKVFYDILKK